MSQTPRCSTGLDRLDQALDGGIPRGNTVLVAGTSGAGKTTLAFQFLCDGAQQGERSAFISVTEPTTMLRRNLAGYSFFRPEFLASGHLTLLDLRAVALRMDMEDARFKADQYLTLVDTIQMFCREMGIKRLAIDSVTAIGEWLTDPVRLRDFLFRLGLSLGSLQCTTLLTAEASPSLVRPSAGTAEFMADGIILLHDAEVVKGSGRSLQVVKMRGTPHERTRLEMDLSAAGIRLVSDPQSRFAAPAPGAPADPASDPTPATTPAQDGSQGSRSTPASGLAQETTRVSTAATRAEAGPEVSQEPHSDLAGRSAPHEPPPSMAGDPVFEPTGEKAPEPGAEASAMPAPEEQSAPVSSLVASQADGPPGHGTASEDAGKLAAPTGETQGPELSSKPQEPGTEVEPAQEDPEVKPSPDARRH